MSVESGREGEERLIAELQSIVNSAMNGPDVVEVYEGFGQFVDKLKKDHPDLENYRLFHVLVGSSVKEADIQKFDLPNREIEKFIRSLKK
ncbi:MAG TPA: hypothetical protein VGQ87_02855 [Patescibacteria group bacterium]|jgi:hemerythrin superfamily protein|nr:hypothetical protein [Patescibacteria group bacterium]